MAARLNTIPACFCLLRLPHQPNQEQQHQSSNYSRDDVSKQTAASGAPRAICGHRPVLPLMLEALGVPDRPMLTAAVLVAHLSPEGETICVEWHKPRV